MKHSYRAIVIGASAGGMKAIEEVLSQLHESFPLPIFIVQHISADSDDFIVQYLRKNTKLEVFEAEDKVKPKPGVVYIAPPNYHMLIEEEGTIALSITQPVNFSRPSIDVLFETAADAYLDGLIGIILTGANSDGSTGAKRIKERGGVILVQDPETAEADSMPLAAIEKGIADKIIPLDEIGSFLNHLIHRKK